MPARGDSMTRNGFSERALQRRAYRRALVALTPSMPRLTVEQREANRRMLAKMAGAR